MRWVSASFRPCPAHPYPPALHVGAAACPSYCVSLLRYLSVFTSRGGVVVVVVVAAVVVVVVGALLDCWLHCPMRLIHRSATAPGWRPHRGWVAGLCSTARASSASNQPQPPSGVPPSIRQRPLQSTLARSLDLLSEPRVASAAHQQRAQSSYSPRRGPSSASSQFSPGRAPRAATAGARTAGQRPAVLQHELSVLKGAKRTELSGIDRGHIQHCFSVLDELTPNLGM